MANCTFVFDIIVTNVETSRYNIENTSKLKIEFTLNKQKLVLSASRINITDFIPGKGTEFSITPKQLRENLEQCGMPLAVKYDGLLLGSGQICFPQSIVDNIEEGMEDQIFTDTCNFQREGQDIGKVAILCRLIIKCEEQPKGESDCRRNMGTQINPQDILFVVTESQQCPIPCDPCVDVWEQEEGDELLKFDLERYRSYDTGALRPAEMLIHNPIVDEVCWELKNMKNECVEILDSVLRRPGLKPPCRGAEALKDSCSAPCQYPGGESLLKSSSAPYNSFLPDVLKEKAVICSPSRRVPSTSASYQSKIKPIRFCPVCLTNMSWLPRFACCPKCGLKPMPSTEKPREKKLSADQILLDYLGKPPTTIDDCCVDPCTTPVEKKDDVESNKCRCTCKYGKLCAYCRVCAQCSDFFKSEQKQMSKESVSTDDPKPPEDFAVIKQKSQQSRPFLARVFSELRDFYDLKNVNRPNEVGDLRNRRSSTKRMSRKSNVSPIIKNRKLSVVQESRKQIKPDAVAHFHRKPLKIKHRKIIAGHKDCVEPRRVVSRRHGWAWSTTQEARKYGWRPGAILKPMRRLMSYFLEYSSENNAYNICKRLAEEKKERERQKPILNVCKKNGEIYITLRAVNTPSIDMKPIVFKLVKSDLAVAMTEIKRKLKDKGFRNCTCHQPLMMCVCRDKTEKKILECAVEEESREYGIDNCVDNLVFSDSSDNETEYDFDVTPPGGMKEPPMALKPATTNNCTQTMKNDQMVRPLYPIVPSFYWRSYDCAVGDRYTGTALGDIGEKVFEDGLLGYRGGGPHGAFSKPGGRPKTKVIWGEKPGGPMRGGGRTIPTSPPGGKSFPGAVKKPRAPSKPIPVRMPKRYYEAQAKADKAAKAAAEAESKKKSPDMMKYMLAKGAVSAPWNPNANA